MQYRNATYARLRLVMVAVVPLAFAARIPAQVTTAWVEPTSGVALAVDASDSVYTLDYVYALGAEMTLTRRDPDGHLLWQASVDQTDPTKWEQAAWVVVDSEGSAVVAGTLKSGYSNPVNAASIVMKFDPAGALLWRRVYESSFDGSYAIRCLVDGEDNVYVLGVGSGPSGYVTKVKKFAPDGTPVWNWFDAAGIGAPVHFKLTPDDHLVISGRGIFGSVNGYAKVTLDGTTVWSLVGISSLTVGDIAGDALGNGYIVHGAWPGGGSVIRKLDPSGTQVWTTSHPFSGSRIEVGPDQSAIVAGFPDAGTAGAAFIRLDADGGLVWENLDADGPLGLLLHAMLRLDAAGNAYLAAGTLFEMAVCRVNADGTAAWTATVPGGYARGLVIDDDQRGAWVVGGTTARLRFECPRCPCPADLDASGGIDLADLNALLASYNVDDGGDVDGDGDTDIADLNAVLALFGKPCS